MGNEKCTPNSVGHFESKGLLERLRCRWEDTEVSYEQNSVGSGQDPVAVFIYFIYSLFNDVFSVTK
jgi:hypothetical protein